MPRQTANGKWIVPICDPRNPEKVLGATVYITEEEANEVEKNILWVMIKKIEEERRAQ